MRLIHDFARDVRFAVRQLAKNRLFALVIILSLGLAIGANTAIFTLFDAVALRQLPVPRASRLVEINQVTTQNQRRAFTYAQWKELAARQSIFSSVSGWLLPMQNIEVNGNPSLRAVQYVTRDFYSTYPVRPLLGRTLLPSDSQLVSGGSSNVAVISFECWKDRFASDPKVLGKEIRIESRPYSIVGVTPPGFSTPQIDVSADATIPVESASFQLFGSDLQSISLLVSARLRDGVSLDPANAQLQVLWPSIVRDSEPAGTSAKDAAEDFSRRIQLADGSRGLSFLRDRFSESIRILFAAVSALLLLACLNVATLLLARASARSGEISVRLSLGAGRVRIMRQLLTESLLLATASAALGLVLAQWCCPLLLTFMWTSPVKLTLSLQPDVRVLGFTTAAVCLATLLFGLAPGWLTIQESNATSSSARTIVGGRGGWLRRSLVAAQVALAVVLLVGAGLLIRAARRLANADLGFAPEHVAMFALTPRAGGYGDIDLRAYKRDLLSRVSAIPGVASAALSDSAPAQINRFTQPVYATASKGTEVSPSDANLYFVSDGFFKTLGVSLVRGRDFSASDTPTSQRVVVISQSLANRLFASGDALGRSISVGDYGPRQNLQVIGIAVDSRIGDLRYRDPFVVYLPIFQVGAQDAQILEWGHLEVRAEANPLSVIPAVDAQIRSLGREFDRGAETLERTIAINLAEERMLASLSTFFGIVAGFLALLGLYGLLSYAVNRRAREFGVRMALGAQVRAVFLSIIKEALALTALGVAVGIPSAMAAAKILSSRMPNVPANDVAPFALAAALLMLATLAAASVPARRASRVNPIDALRSE